MILPSATAEFTSDLTRAVTIQPRQQSPASRIWPAIIPIIAIVVPVTVLIIPAVAVVSRPAGRVERERALRDDGRVIRVGVRPVVGHGVRHELVHDIVERPPIAGVVRGRLLPDVAGQEALRLGDETRQERVLIHDGVCDAGHEGRVVEELERGGEHGRVRDAGVTSRTVGGSVVHVHEVGHVGAG